ncbi:Carbamoyl-phosphate synthase large chain [bioreactor metagenome]|uniref:Carbamoyl-phosphate synthase large chain n=1 Tax=bioreactor metagenome TaxID=1076179 RepID=A0A645BA19_9ZZZZ
MDEDEKVYVIEVNPRSSRTVPFLSKVTEIPLANVATKVMLGYSLKSQGYGTFVEPAKERWFVKVPTFSFAKIRGLDAYLSPEMKSTGEVIGYDDSLNRALYKALQASGSTVSNYGTIFVTIADKDKNYALPLIKRFYKLGFNIEATYGTAEFLKRNGIKTRVKEKISNGSNQILESLQKGHITYVVNTVSHESNHAQQDGIEIRKAAVENGITMFTSLSTVNVLLNVLEEITVGVSTINSK